EFVRRCDAHAGIKQHKIGRAEFVAMVADDLGVLPERAEHLVLSVFHARRAQVSPGEARQVEGQLPPDLRALWERSLATHRGRGPAAPSSIAAAARQRSR